MTDQVNCKPDDFREEDPNAPKFTPGPWEFREFSNDVVAVNKPKNGGDIICEAPIGFPSSLERWKYNKALIATSTEMYGMLADILRRIDDCDGNNFADLFRSDYIDEKIKSILAKARGENLENI